MFGKKNKTLEGLQMGVIIANQEELISRIKIIENDISIIRRTLNENSKTHFAWDVQRRDFELMEDGKKVEKIRNIIS